MSSPYLLAMHGNLVIVGYQPDGDSIRFIAETPDLFDDLYRGYKIRRSTRDDSVQLRLEAIDAPELHYGGSLQPSGDTARDWLLGQVGFTDVTYETGSTTVLSATPDTIPAVIYTKASDPNGRPVSYLQVGAGRRPADGAWIQVTNSVLDRTLNAQALSAGLAYPTFYTSTPAPHVRHLREVARGAREDKTGVWAVDQTPLFQLVDQKSIGPEGQHARGEGVGGHEVEVLRRAADGPEPVAHQHPAPHNERAGVGPPGQAQEDALEQPVAGRLQGGRLGLHAVQCSRPAWGGPGAPHAGHRPPA